MLRTAIILAGGRGTRMGSALRGKPKPLAQVNGHALLEHLVCMLRGQGIQRFLLAAGFRASIVQAWAEEMGERYGDLVVIDHGEVASTLLRIRGCLDQISGEDEEVLVTYGDGVADIDISRLFDEHVMSNLPVTVSTTGLQSQYGVIRTDEAGRVLSFEEKPLLDDILISIGFAVVSTRASLDWHRFKEFESEMLPELASEGRLNSFRHHGYWLSVDSPVDLARASRDSRARVGPWMT